MGDSVKIQVSAGALVFLAMIFLLLPLQWVCAALLAVAVHESCHAVAVCLCGGRVLGLQIGCRGAVMETTPMIGIRETLCALAGPAGSFALLILVRWMPRTAVCGLIHGIYNLIPLFPLDGGRVLRGLLFGLLPPPVAKKFYANSQSVIMVCVMLLCLCLAWKVGVMPILFAFVLLRMYFRENSLAIRPVWRYNRRIMDKEVRYDRVTQTNPTHGAKTGPVHRRRVQRNQKEPE